MNRYNISKTLVFFVLFTVMFLFALAESHFMQKTVNGQRFENFTIIDSRFLPQVLSNYMRRNYVKYQYYKLPNYITDLFKYNKDFYPIYHSGLKHTVIVFTSVNDNFVLGTFFNKISEQIKNHPDKFNYINHDSDKKVKYPHQAYNYAYKDLKDYCKQFCIIDPERNTLFTFSRITNSEIEALDIVFQEFGYIAK